MIVSPTLQSGVSLTESHFTAFSGFYGGTIEPSLFIQMLRRDRTAAQIHIAIMGQGYKDLPTDSEYLRETVLGAMRYVDVKPSKNDVTASCAEPQNGMTADSAKGNEAVSVYAELVLNQTAVTNKNLNNYAVLLYGLLEHRGFTCSTLPIVKTELGKTLLKLGRVRTKQQRVVSILTANDVPFKQALAYEKQDYTDPSIVAEIKRAKLKRDFGLSESQAVTSEHVELWNNGKLGKSFTLISLALNGEPSNADLSDVAMNVDPVLRSHHQATGKAIKAVLGLVGLDLETGKATIRKGDAERIYNEIAGTDTYRILELANFRMNVKKGMFQNWLSDFLKKIGLKLTQVAHVGAGGSQGRVYEIDAKSWQIAMACVKNAGGECVGGGINSVLGEGDPTLQNELRAARAEDSSNQYLLGIVDMHAGYECADLLTEIRQLAHETENKSGYENGSVV